MQPRPPRRRQQASRQKMAAISKALWDCFNSVSDTIRYTVDVILLLMAHAE